MKTIFNKMFESYIEAYEGYSKTMYYYYNKSNNKKSKAN